MAYRRSAADRGARWERLSVQVLSVSQGEWTGFRSSVKLDISAHNLSSASLASSNIVSISSSYKLDVSITVPPTVNARIYLPGSAKWVLQSETRATDRRNTHTS